MDIYPFPVRFFSHIGYYRILSRIPCAIQEVLVIYSFYICVHVHSVIRFFAISWTVAFQAPLSVGFSRQEYWSGLPFPTSGDLPYPGIEPTSSSLTGGFFTVSNSSVCMLTAVS